MGRRQPRGRSRAAPAAWPGPPRQSAQRARQRLTSLLDIPPCGFFTYALLPPRGVIMTATYESAMRRSVTAGERWPAYTRVLRSSLFFSLVYGTRGTRNDSPFQNRLNSQSPHPCGRTRMNRVRKVEDGGCWFLCSLLCWVAVVCLLRSSFSLFVLAARVCAC